MKYCPGQHQGRNTEHIEFDPYDSENTAHLLAHFMAEGILVTACYGHFCANRKNRCEMFASRSPRNSQKAAPRTQVTAAKEKASVLAELFSAEPVL